MVHIYTTRISGELSVSRLESLYRFLPPADQEKNLRYYRWQDRYANLFGRILLRSGLIRYGFPQDILGSISIDPYGRPYLENGIDFSISHSGDYVICAICRDMRLGIDIERINPDFDPMEAGIVLCKEEQEHVGGFPSGDRISQNDAFFRIWARKESLIKADGRGFSAPLTEINSLNDIVVLEGQNWHIRDLEIHPSYCASISMNRQDPELNLVTLDMYH